MDELQGVDLAADGTWFDPAGLGREAHDLSQVLTGAVFDVLVDVFQRMLVEQGLLSPRLHYLAELADRGGRRARTTSRTCSSTPIAAVTPTSSASSTTRATGPATPWPGRSARWSRRD